MFARLILALLLAAFALPALANGPCHDAPMTAMPMSGAHGEHRMPMHDDHAVVPHVCIGCIPPASLTAHPTDAPLVKATVGYGAVATTFAPGSGTQPALPPPRRDA